MGIPRMPKVICAKATLRAQLLALRSSGTKAACSTRRAWLSTSSGGHVAQHPGFVEKIVRCLVTSSFLLLVVRCLAQRVVHTIFFGLTGQDL